LQNKFKVIKYNHTKLSKQRNLLYEEYKAIKKIQ